ncbi:MAG: hypothetical protein AB7F88_02515 [Pyrinomonadaceae bacterium]
MKFKVAVREIDMASRPPFLDSRLERDCAYCGKEPTTKDHVPSRVLLDDPPPVNLVTVKSCAKCNNSFSANEEYLACLIECVICGSVDAEDVQREKVKNVLNANLKLAKEINKGRRTDQEGNLLWEFDAHKVRHVIMKLARGHVAFEQSITRHDDPTSVSIFPLALLEPEALDLFENDFRGELGMLPELGSRAFSRIFTDGITAERPGWVTVQEGRYRYYVDETALCVRIVLSEYLGCEVIWED